MYPKHLVVLLLFGAGCQSLVVTNRPSSDWAHVYSIDEANADSVRVEILVQERCKQHPSKYWEDSPTLGRDEAHVLEPLSDLYARSTPVTLYDSYSDTYTRSIPNRKGVAAFPLPLAGADSIHVRNHRLALSGRSATRILFIIRQVSYPNECSIVESRPHNPPLHADAGRERSHLVRAPVLL